MTLIHYVHLVPQQLFFLCKSLDISQFDSVIPYAFWDALCLFSRKTVKMISYYESVVF